MVHDSRTSESAHRKPLPHGTAAGEVSAGAAQVVVTYTSGSVGPTSLVSGRRQ